MEGSGGKSVQSIASTGERMGFPSILYATEWPPGKGMPRKQDRLGGTMVAHMLAFEMPVDASVNVS